MISYTIRVFPLHSPNLQHMRGEKTTTVSGFHVTPACAEARAPRCAERGTARALLARRAATIAAFLLVVTGLSGCQKKDAPSELLVFAAASTSDVMADVGRDFEGQTSTHVRFSFGASRELARQIRAGARARVIVSADAETVENLVEAKLVRADDRRDVARNRLVVIVPSGSGLAIGSAKDLALAKHIAIGDPQVVPAGNYARQWLEKEEVWKDLASHLIPTADVRAALAAVQQGHAEAGIVYRTDAARAKGIRIAYEVPQGGTRPISYVAALLTEPENLGVPDSAATGVARAFLDFLTSPSGQATFARHGFAF